MSVQEGKYNIKVVSTMLGIHSGTLRAWERRYDVVKPIRNSAGHRLYSDEHVKILKWVIDKVDKGFTIGQAVDLLNTQDTSELIDHQALEENQVEKIKQDLLTLLMKFEEVKSNELLNKAFAVFTIEKVIVDILGEVLVEIGKKWEERQITAAHEHFATAFLRSKIGTVFQNFPVNGLLPKVVCFCAPNEQHEIGLLIFTFFLRKRGYETIYIGTSCPEEDIFQVIDEIEPKLAVISCTLEDHLLHSLTLARELEEHFKDLKVGVGGQATSTMSNSERCTYQQYLMGNNDQEWVKWLKVHK